MAEAADPEVVATHHDPTRGKSSDDVAAQCQPIVELDRADLVGYEALGRWSSTNATVAEAFAAEAVSDLE